MNARHFRDFKYSKIFLFNQSEFNKKLNFKKFIYPLNKRFSNNKKLLELEEKNIDYITKQLFPKEYYKTENNKERQMITSPNKNNNIKLIRTKILRNNKALKQIDFNINNVSNELNDSEDLDNKRYFSLRKKSVKLPLTIIKTKRKNNHSRNKQNILLNKSNDNESPNIKLPKIQFNSNLKSINISSSLNKILKTIIKKDKNKVIDIVKSPIKKNDKNEINKNDNKDNQKKNNAHRDIFKNVNYFIDNKKTQLKVNDIQRKNYEINSNENEDQNELNENEMNENKSSKIFINTKIQNYNEKYNNLDDEDNIIYVDNNNMYNMYNEEAELLRKKDKYMLYEKNKKFIEKNKIYDSMKYGAAIIPNLTLDKDFQNIKLFESNVINMKKTQTDLPIFFRTKQ